MSTHLTLNNLLYTQKPASPTTFRHTDSFRVLDRDPLQGSVIQDLNRDLQLVLIHNIPRVTLLTALATLTVRFSAPNFSRPSGLLIRLSSVLIMISEK